MHRLALVLFLGFCCACGEKAPAVPTKTVELKIEGMTCSGCSGSVTKMLKGVPGVFEADVSHETGTAVCRVEEDVDPAALTGAITGNYKATVKP